LTYVRIAVQSIFERHGLTIIEVMVAITLLTVGALAVSSAAAALTRLIGEGARYASVATIGRATLELLLPIACEGNATGDSTVGVFHLDWSIQPRGAVSDVAVVVSVPNATWRKDTLSTARACFP
jgi:prepilin-type N-terminal cleavage/methylation domain-containing protein